MSAIRYPREADGGNGQIRTAGLPLRRRPLYPAELRPHARSLHCSLPAAQAFLPDVCAIMHAVEMDFAAAAIGIVNGGPQRVAACRDAQHAPAAGHQVSLLPDLVPAWNTVAPAASASAMPVMTSPVRGVSG